MTVRRAAALGRGVASAVVALAALVCAVGPASAAQEVATMDLMDFINLRVVIVDRCPAAEKSGAVRLVAPTTSVGPCLAFSYRPDAAAKAVGTPDASYKTVFVMPPDGDAQGVTVRYRSGRMNLGDGKPVEVCDWRNDYARFADVGSSYLASGYQCRGFAGDSERIWFLQGFVKRARDFGGNLADGNYTVYASTWTKPVTAAGRPSWAHAGAPVTQATFDLPPLGTQTFDGYPKLLTYLRWSKFSPGGYKGYLQGKHFPLLFGSFTYAGQGVYGPGDKLGAPTNDYGRNVYIDTLNSDYGDGWRRVMGILTQPPNGTFCYEFGPKGGSGRKTGRGVQYRLTVIGPGLAPVIRLQLSGDGPDFTFGAPDYNPKAMKWGTGFSAEQAQALRDQAAMIGPTYRTKPAGKRNTDCGATLRQLPESFFAPPSS